jgi:hypothetical protein
MSAADTRHRHRLQASTTGINNGVAESGGVEVTRVVVVQCPPGPGVSGDALGSGSGYVIAPRLVLTSAHVVPEPGAAVQVLVAADPVANSGVVVWRGTPGGRDDAALVEVASWRRDSAVKGTRLPRFAPGGQIANVSVAACSVTPAPHLRSRPGQGVIHGCGRPRGRMCCPASLRGAPAVLCDRGPSQFAAASNHP